MNISPKKVIKPFYNVRLANRLQKCAKELQEQKSNLIEEQNLKTTHLMENLKESTFHRVKTKAVLRREANQAKRKAFNEALTSIIAVSAYNAMPIDNKKPILENTSFESQPDAFKRMYENTYDLVLEKNIAMTHSVTPNILDFGNTTKISASQWAVNIAGSISNIREQLSDNSKVETYTVLNFIDSSVTLGNDNLKGSSEIKLAEERLYDTFVTKLTEDVESKVILALKAETEKAEMSKFLDEAYKDDMYGTKANHNLLRPTKVSSVFKEIYKTVHLKAFSEGYSKEDILSESIARYTLLEAFNCLEFLNKTNDQLINDFIEERRKYK
jgi:hypothetical protein